MRNYYLLLFLAILSSLASFSQWEEPCGSDLLHDQELSQNPLFARRMFNLEQRLITNRTDEPRHRGSDIYTIPVVVHVIHIGESIGSGSNISDEQIQSAITALNDDFRKTPGSNGDGEGVDVGIEFCLAIRDPEGNSTNGIVRVDGSSVTSYAEEGISAGDSIGADEEEVKSLSVWPREDYLNIWIVNEIEDNDGGGGIQGYAYFPINSVVDGIVIMHNSFGTVGNLKPFTNLNRTTTHEVGHYFGLYHTFYSSPDCEETNCETQGDRVCDTPVTETNPDCSTPACGGTQQVENYMDYTQQTCKNMFTQGQKVRMRFTLLEERTSILSSLGCVPVSDYDAGILSVISPTGSLCSGSIFPEVQLINYGGADLVSASITYSIDNGSAQTYDWTGNLSSGSSEFVTLPLITAGAGAHTLNVSVSDPNGMIDSFPSNDTQVAGFSVSTGATATVNIWLDYAGSQTTWDITQNGEVMGSGGPYNDNQNGALMTHEVCLDAGCYEFTIYDDYGDGLNFLSGEYELLDGDGVILASGEDDFGYSATHSFCLEAIVGDPPVSNFSASESQICGGDAVDFSSSSTGEPSAWYWQFEGATPSTSSSEHPTGIVYDEPGTYAVTLTTSNAFGSDVLTQSAIIEVQSAPDMFLNTTDISCFGLSDGSAILTADDAASITWSNSGESGNSVSGLGVGSYSVTAQSSAGCSSSMTFDISQPEELSLVIFKNDMTCHGIADGAAVATVTGGTVPHFFDWSTGETTAEILDLPSAVYSLTVTDSRGCEISDDIAIVEPSEIVVAIEVLSSETCEGNDGSASANALGGTGNLNYSWSTETEGQMLSGVPFGIYEVYVTDDMECVVSAGVNIPYDCAEILPTTQLISSQCNKSSFALDATLTCNVLDGAEMYLWHFSDELGSYQEEAYTMGNNPNFLLSDLTQVAYNQLLYVKIKTQIAGEWGEWGSECSIHTLDTPPAMSLVDEDCNAGTLMIGSTVQAPMNTGADEFEWKLEFGDSAHSYYSYINMFTISEDQNIPLNETFYISVRARYDDVWSEFGEPCTFTLDVDNSIESSLDSGETTMTIFPNPNSGSQFSLEMENLYGPDNVIDIMIFDSGGKRVTQFSSDRNGNTHISETYSFDNKLSKGMYLIQVDFAGQTHQHKLIVK